MIYVCCYCVVIVFLAKIFHQRVGAQTFTHSLMFDYTGTLTTITWQAQRLKQILAKNIQQQVLSAKQGIDVISICLLSHTYGCLAASL